MPQLELTEAQIEYITKWLAYYNHRKMFDGIVPMNTARLIVESSIDDDLRKQAKDLAEHITPIIQKALLKELEEKVFYVDTRGYIALKPNATSNWLALKGE